MPSPPTSLKISVKTIQDLLITAAKRGLVIHPQGNRTSPENLDYAEFLRLSHQHSHQLVHEEGFSARSIVLIHLDNHLDNITPGKISRAKMRSALESAVFAEQIDARKSAAQKYRAQDPEVPQRYLEAALLTELHHTFDLDRNTFGIETSIFEMGVTSIDLIRLERNIDQ
ncbi:hypothetical protein NHQ30_009359 [Ciborinia camelliae]|nr:hypothetical protein NHQ30_009359 [Ciborinia camelliae]